MYLLRSDVRFFCCPAPSCRTWPAWWFANLICDSRNRGGAAFVTHSPLTCPLEKRYLRTRFCSRPSTVVERYLQLQHTQIRGSTWSVTPKHYVKHVVYHSFEIIRKRNFTCRNRVVNRHRFFVHNFYRK